MYTFFYCMMHDEGCIITGKHDYVPAGYVMQHATNCKSCDWYNMGIINNKFKVIMGVRINYERYCGGFTFGHYVNTLTDTRGNSLKNEALDNWIREISVKGPNAIGPNAIGPNAIGPNAIGPNTVFLESPPLLTVKPILVNDLTGEEYPFYDEIGTPIFYKVKNTLLKHLSNDALFIYIDDNNPQWFCIAHAVYSNAVGANIVANTVASEVKAEPSEAEPSEAEPSEAETSETCTCAYEGENAAYIKYKAIIEQIYEVNTLTPLFWCPSSHIKFEIIYY